MAIFPDGNRQSFDLTFETAVTGELRVTYARDHLDLDAHNAGVSALALPPARPRS